MRKTKWLISLGIFVIVLFIVGSAYALPPLPTDEVAKLKFTNFEKWTDVNESGWVDAGDIITGIFYVTTISDVSGSNITWQPRTDELTGHFKLTVAAGSMNPALGGQVAFTLSEGDFIEAYYDTTRDWAPEAPDAIARATDGSLYFGVYGVDLLEALATDVMPGKTQTNWWVNATTNNTGYTFVSQLWPEGALGGSPFGHRVPFPPGFHATGHTSELYFEGSLYIYGLYGWDFRSEDPVYTFVTVPTPFCGDGNLDSGEECDDGNNIDGDGCSATCIIEQPEGCRMTGGGVDINGEILLGTMAQAKDGDSKDRYQFGGQVGTPTAPQPQPWGEWTHHQQSGPSGSFIFRAGTASAPKDTKILIVTCSDPGFCNPARPSPFKQIDYTGIGSFRNVKGALKGIVVPDNQPNYTTHYFRAHVEDIGEPGAGGKQREDPYCTHIPGTPIEPSQCQHCPDVYQIEIHATSDPSSAVIYTVGGFIDGGNLQIHPAIK